MRQMIKVLDHGFVRLVSYMQPVPDPLESPMVPDGEEIYQQIGRRADRWSGDLEIIRNARVSHNAEWRTDGTIMHEAMCVSLLPPMSTGEARPCDCTPRTVSDERLTNYLYKNSHSTPFEAMVFTFEVKAPIFVLRQWHRHRTWSYNEVSARYTELPSECYVPSPDMIGQQDIKNRQGRVINLEDHVDEETGLISYFSLINSGVDLVTVAKLVDESNRRYKISEGFEIESGSAHKTYQDRLGSAVPREIARINLPLSTYSRMFATVNLWNLFRFLNLRDHSHAQYEIRVYAQALKELVRPVVPNAIAAYDRYKLVMVDSQEVSEKTSKA